MNTNINTAINNNILIQRKYKLNRNIIINIKDEFPTCFGSSLSSLGSIMCHV